MEIAEFKEQNTIVAKDQPEYLPLPAYMERQDPEGNLVCCWKLNLRERIKVLFTGKIWLNMLTFNMPVTPHRMSVDKWEMLNKEYFKELERK